VPQFHFTIVNVDPGLTIRGAILSAIRKRILLPSVSWIWTAQYRDSEFYTNESLAGGSTVYLKLDAQGKTHASTLLRMEINVPEELFNLVKK